MKGLLKKYNSLYSLLSKTYPEYNWEPWKFNHIPKNVNTDDQVIDMSLSYVEKVLNITKNEDWYRVSQAQLKHLGVLVILTNGKSLLYTLKERRPDFDWQEDKFNKRQSQKLK